MVTVAPFVALALLAAFLCLLPANLIQQLQDGQQHHVIEGITLNRCTVSIWMLNRRSKLVPWFDPVRRAVNVVATAIGLMVGRRGAVILVRVSSSLAVKIVQVSEHVLEVAAAEEG